MIQELGNLASKLSNSESQIKSIALGFRKYWEARTKKEQKDDQEELGFIKTMFNQYFNYQASISEIIASILSDLINRKSLKKREVAYEKSKTKIIENIK